MIDTHCHIDQPQFDDDRPAVLARAGAAGVRCIVNPGIDLHSSREAVKLAEQHEGIFAAAGVHPNDCEGFSPATVAALRELAAHPKVVAIGETGLDFYWDRVETGKQIAALRAQLEIAAELDLPVVLHSRDGKDGASAIGVLLEELRAWAPEARRLRGSAAILGVLHAFSGDIEAAQQAYQLGFAVSLGGPVTFLNARALHGLVPRLRRDRLMLETDAPYLAPHPHRGHRNEPGYLPLIAKTLAELLGMETDELINQTTETAILCFGIACPRPKESL